MFGSRYYLSDFRNLGYEFNSLERRVLHRLIMMDNMEGYGIYCIAEQYILQDDPSRFYNLLRKYYEVMNLSMHDFKIKNRVYLESMWIQGRNADWRREIWL